MKLKSLMRKVVGALALLPLLPTMVYAFSMPTAHREDYNGWTPHAHWDAVWHEVMLDIIVIGVIYFVAAAYLLVRYKATNDEPTAEGVELTKQAKVGWVIIPVMIFMADDMFLFVKGWDLHNQYREVPADAQEIKVTAMMYSWEYEYDNGVVSDEGLVVPVGKPVLLRMISDDVLHSHYMNRYRVTEDVMPGRVTYQWFMPDELGESVITCREYCGSGHSQMPTTVTVKSQAEYDEWMAMMVEEASIEPSQRVAAVDAATAVN